LILETPVFVSSLIGKAQDSLDLITVKTISTLVKFDARFSYFTYDV